jgi:hypothetical protein
MTSTARPVKPPISSAMGHPRFSYRLDRIEEMPVPLHQLLRDLVGAFRDGPSTRDTSGSLPPAASPRAADVPFHSARGAVTQDTGSHGDLHKAPTSGFDDLSLVSCPQSS